MMYNDLDVIYREIINNYPVLSEDMTKQLFVEYGKADYDHKKIIRDKIVYSNLRFVVKVAYRYFNANKDIYTLDDLVSFGVIGLIKSIDRYDVTMNNKFFTYAYYWIKQSINYYIESDSNNNTVSFDSDDGFSPIYFIPDNFDVEEISDQSELESIVINVIDSMNLPEKKRDMVLLRLGLVDGKRRSIDYLSNMYGVTNQAISQSINKVLKRVKSNYKRCFEGYISK